MQENRSRNSLLHLSLGFYSLKDFPEVIKKIENDEISLKEFKKDPKMILPLLDQSYKK